MSTMVEHARGFVSGARLARQSIPLEQMGEMLDPARELHRGMVDGWRVANAARPEPMAHRFNVGLWGETPADVVYPTT